MTSLLYGHNTDERIVAVQQLDDSTMRLYIRDRPTTRFIDDRFYPFLFLSETTFLTDFNEKHWVKRLEGDAFFHYVCAFEEWTTMWDGIRYMLEQYNKKALTKVENYNQLEFLHLYTDPVTQYLLQSGRTLFKGMQFEDLHRLQLDIETYTSPRYRFSNANRPEDRIILIALSDNKGWEHVINGKKLSEKQMLAELVRTIMEKDPDVIEGHNIFNFDLPYILKRCEQQGIAFGIGRDGSVPRSFDTRMSFAERSAEYSIADIAGRHVIDTRILVQSYDMSKRDMESYGLKYAAKYFGLNSPTRVYIPGENISWHWDHDVQPLLDYALDDVRETRGLSEHLSGSTFYMTQMIPFSYGTVSRLGSASKIESLMVRAYLHEKHSIPKPTQGTQTTGGYTDIFVVGVVGPVVHVDVESLYPSIMISKGIAPASDVMNVFRTLLVSITTLRLDAKRKMKKTTVQEDKLRLDATQSSLKILINSFYGYLGYNRALFNDFAQADLVTKTGQEILRQMISSIQSAGGKVVEVDTDGIFFVPPENVRGEEEEKLFVEGLSAGMPVGITLALDGRYMRMLSYKMKNYALLSYDDRIKVKGSSLKSRSMERFGRNYIMQCISCLLNNDVQGLHAQYVGLHHAIDEHKLDVKDFARVEVLRDVPDKYRAEVESGQRNRSAVYEVSIASGKNYRTGDRIAYYITGRDPNIRTFEHCKAVEDWDPNFPDQNVAYYLKRLDEFSEKFSPFFLPQDFRAIFSADDLFPFSPAGITTLTIELQRGSEDVASLSPKIGIWLDEEST
ncbi:MAG: polymerase region [Bacteroidetes bacterium]|nr:polymerase region [Bacteroidota bacterium]